MAISMSHVDYTQSQALPQGESSRGDAGTHKYFTMIPNILFHLGLKANQLAVYLAIKRTAGDHGVSTKSGITLAQEAGVSEAILKKVKRELAEVHPMIGVPLIRYNHRDNDTDAIQIVDIWDISMEFIVTKVQKTKDKQVKKKTCGGGGYENVPRVGTKTYPKEEPIQEKEIDRSTFSENDQHDVASPKSVAVYQKLANDGLVVTPRSFNRWIRKYGRSHVVDTFIDIKKAIKKKPEIMDVMRNFEAYVEQCLKT